MPTPKSNLFPPKKADGTPKNAAPKADGNRVTGLREALRQKAGPSAVTDRVIDPGLSVWTKNEEEVVTLNPDTVGAPQLAVDGDVLGDILGSTAELIQAERALVVQTGHQEAVDKVNNLVGLTEAKAWFQKLADYLTALKGHKELSLSSSEVPLRIFFEGRKSVGRATVGTQLLELLKANDFLVPEATLKPTTAANLVGMGGAKVAAMLEEHKSGIVYIEELSGFEGGKAILQLLRIYSDTNPGKPIIIYSGTKEEIKKLREIDPDFNVDLGEKIKFSDFSDVEMGQLVSRFAEKRGYKIEGRKAMAEFVRILGRRRGEESWQNARSIEAEVDKAIVQHGKTVVDAAREGETVDPEKFLTLSKEDLLRGIDSRSTLDVLNTEFVGLDEVKETLNGLPKLIEGVIAANAQLEPEMQRSWPQLVEDILELVGTTWVFQGPPGTGKTSVARLLLDIYYELGLMPRNGKNGLMETSGIGLIQGYVGQTGQAIEAAFAAQLGGALFIDEIYGLIGSSEGGGNQFSHDAMDAITGCITKYKNKLILIGAGYPERMQDFIQGKVQGKVVQPGMARRWVNIVNFEPLTTEQCAEKIVKDLGSRGYHLDEDTHDIENDGETLQLTSAEALGILLDQITAHPHFGNGGDIDTLVNTMVRRLFLTHENPTDRNVMPSDVIEAGTELLQSFEIREDNEAG